jgi:hypothetical protein
MWVGGRKIDILREPSVKKTMSGVQVSELNCRYVSTCGGERRKIKSHDRDVIYIYTQKP